MFSSERSRPSTKIEDASRTELWEHTFMGLHVLCNTFGVRYGSNGDEAEAVKSVLPQGLSNGPWRRPTPERKRVG